MRVVSEKSNRSVLHEVRMGEGVVYWHFVNLYGCEIGDGTKIGSFVEIQDGVKIGQRCHIQSHTFICSDVTIGDDVFVGHGVMFMNDQHPSARATREKTWTSEPVVVKDGVTIGSGALIMPGVTIHAGAVVGAGAVVTHDVPAGETWAGIPARLL